MRFKTLVTFATSATLLACMLAPELQATVAGREKRKTKKELIKENAGLKEKIDSLHKELANYQEALDNAKEIVLEMETECDKEPLPEDSIEYTAEMSDSLMTVMLLHRKAQENSMPEYNMDSVRFESNVPDSVYIRRIKDMNSFIQLPYNDIVKNYIILYSEKMPKNIGNILGLAEYYMPKFEEVFNKYDMPEELKAMAVIESALNPTAISRAGAKGMWQFMYSTAKLYGLTINSFVDERLDPIKSTDAAARYLKDAYDIFGDWNLAIASYNCGAGNVNKAIRRSGGKRAFWDIYPYLPRETRGYVPAFVGALYTMKYYKEHGITPVPAHMPVLMDTIKVNKMLHFKQISEYAGIPHKTITDFNPQYRHEIIPGNEKEYILRIPYQYTGMFIDKEDSLYTYKADVFFNPVTIKKIKDGGDGQRIVYRVKNGDYLGRIARNYRCSVSQIRRWNNLRSNNIRVGQRLVLYRGGSGAPAKTTATTSSKTTAVAQTKSIDKNAPYTLYTVKSGESLYLIAKKFPGVSAQDLMSFNNIGSNIKPGMKIKIPRV